MKGYYKNDKDTHKVLDEEGWLHTGDMATIDPDGTLYIRGRSKTMILSGNGQNIYPEEIEDKLNNMYLVLESLVLDAGQRQDSRPSWSPTTNRPSAEGRGQGRPAADHAEQPSENSTRSRGRLRADVAAIATLPQRVRKNARNEASNAIYTNPRC